MCSAAHPLTLIFQNFLAEGIFPTIGKKKNIVPIHLNEKKKKKKKKWYQIINLFIKIFEKLIFKKVIASFEKKYLSFQLTSFFRAGDSLDLSVSCNYA